MTLTYTAESYSSGPLSTTTEYKLSDGTRYVKIVEEYIAPDMKVRTRTRVLVAEFEGDKETRTTLRDLQGAIANADLVMYVDAPAAAPAKLDTAAVTGSTEEPALNLRRYQPGELVHNGTSPVVYTVVRHRKDGKINLTSPDGRSITLRDDEISPAAPEALATRSEKREAAIARAKAEDAFALEMPALNYGVVTQAHADYCAEHGHATYTNGTDVSPRCPRCGEAVAYQTYKPYQDAEPAAREAIDAVFGALKDAGYVDVRPGVSLEYPSGSASVTFSLPNIEGDPTHYLVGLTHDGYLIRLAKYVQTGHWVPTGEPGKMEPESVWQTVKNMADDRAGAVLAPALRSRPALLRWAAAAGY